MNALSADRPAFRTTKVDPKPPVEWETSATFSSLRKRVSDLAILAHLVRAYTDRSWGATDLSCYGNGQIPASAMASARHHSDCDRASVTRTGTAALSRGHTDL